MFSKGSQAYLNAVLALAALPILYKLFKGPKKLKLLPPTETGRLRSILITGGGSGIGLQTVVKFLYQGWIVGVCSNDVNSVQDVIDRFCTQSPELGPLLKETAKERLFVYNVDVTDAKSCEKGVEAFMKFTKGTLDALFNCAGLLYFGPFESGSLARQSKIVDVNCSGVVNMTHLCLEYLKKTKSSCIVTMASLSSTGGAPNMAVYAATKTFVYSFTESLRGELTRAYGVRVCDISVNIVKTPMVLSDNPDFLPHIPESNRCTPEEVAAKVFEAVNEASYSKVHFYIKCESAFILNFISRAFMPSILLKVTDIIMAKPFQRVKATNLPSQI